METKLEELLILAAACYGLYVIYKHFTGKRPGHATTQATGAPIQPGQYYL